MEVDAESETRGSTQAQRILVLQQNGRGESKVLGIRLHGGDRFRIRTVSVPGALPPVLDDTEAYLPAELDADLVLDFLEHPDLSHDLARACVDRGVSLIASGKKAKVRGVHTPPT